MNLVVNDGLVGCQHPRQPGLIRRIQQLLNEGNFLQGRNFTQKHFHHFLQFAFAGVIVLLEGLAQHLIDNIDSCRVL